MTNRYVTIRRAEAHDVVAIVGLSCALFQEDAGQRDPFMNLNWPREEGEEYFSTLLARDGTLGLVAEADEQVVGYLVGYLYGSSTLRPVEMAELESMFVLGAYRSRGTGRRLAERFLEWAREQGAERVSVTAYMANERAVSFYRRLGFVSRSLTLEVGL